MLSPNAIPLNELSLSASRQVSYWYLYIIDAFEVRIAGRSTLALPCTLVWEQGRDALQSLQTQLRLLALKAARRPYIASFRLISFRFVFPFPTDQ